MHRVAIVGSAAALVLGGCSVGIEGGNPSKDVRYLYSQPARIIDRTPRSVEVQYDGNACTGRERLELRRRPHGSRLEIAVFHVYEASQLDDACLAIKLTKQVRISLDSEASDVRIAEPAEPSRPPKRGGRDESRGFTRATSTLSRASDARSVRVDYDSSNCANIERIDLREPRPEADRPAPEIEVVVQRDGCDDIRRRNATLQFRTPAHARAALDRVRE